MRTVLSCLSVVAVNGFQLLWKLFLFNLVDTIVNLVDMELSCGLWIVYYFNLNVYENFGNEKSKWSWICCCLSTFLEQQCNFFRLDAKGVDGTGKWMTSKENIRGLKQLHLDAESRKTTSPIQSIELARVDREEMTEVNAVDHASGPDT